MLRIHRLENGEVILVLSGRLDAEHIAELDTLLRAETKGRNVFLDLKDMTLAGQEGIDFLAQCEAAGIGLLNCATYVREWITRQRSGC
jgi:anti-anti-sigma regulatory factor